MNETIMTVQYLKVELIKDLKILKEIQDKLNMELKGSTNQFKKLGESLRGRQVK